MFLSTSPKWCLQVMHSHYRRFGGVSGPKEWPGKEINEMCEEQRRGERETEDRENMFCNGIGTLG